MSNQIVLTSLIDTCRIKGFEIVSEEIQNEFNFTSVPSTEDGLKLFFSSLNWRQLNNIAEIVCC